MPGLAQKGWTPALGELVRNRSCNHQNGRCFWPEIQNKRRFLHFYHPRKISIKMLRLKKKPRLFWQKNKRFSNQCPELIANILLILVMTISDTYLYQVFDTMKATIHPSSCISYLASKGSSENKTRWSHNHPPSHSINLIVTWLAPLFIMITYRVNMETKR